jgi:predicted LPLAT superfamily acyltransferase
MSAKKGTVAKDWTRQAERGNAFGMWLMVVTGLALGRHMARGFAAFAVGWYLVRAWSLRRHVYDFLRRVLPRAPGVGDLVRTYWHFGTVTLDRIFFITGRDRKFALEVHNPEILDELHAQGRGAVLLGSHLGSFAALHALGRYRKNMPLRILQYREHNPAIFRVFSRLAPALADNVIPLGDTNVLLRLEQCVSAGGFACLLADRVAKEDTRAVRCDFLGAPVTFPAGGVEAALLLDCPLVMFFGLYRGANRYEFHFERLDTPAYSSRAERRRAVEETVQRYADRLAHYARSAPYNWFNFYDYFSDRSDASNS